jgi:5'(3')-deoxyribonucleotidase
LFCVNELNQCLEELEQGLSIFSSASIDKYIECAQKQNLVTKYFPIVDSGFIIYKDKTIILSSEEGGTRLSIKTI